jgi:hypothetical protein
MTHSVFIIACDTAVGETMFCKFEQNPERNRILSPFGAVSPFSAAHFINERNAKYAVEKSPTLKNPRVLKLTVVATEVV